jgi:HK97 family phage prohead protease
MPYSSTSELPSGVKGKYSSRCQRAYMHAFNSVHGNTGDEGKASAAGHAAAQKCEGKSMDLEQLTAMIGVDLTKDADSLEPVVGSYDFTIFTRDHRGNGLALKAYEEEVEGQVEPDLILEGVASSTIRDRHGDTILPSALIDMERAANNNMTMFLNHDTKVPEDIAGSVKHAQIVSDATTDDGQPLFDLKYKMRVDRTNDRAVKAHRSMMAGTKLGMSIGARIPEGGAVRNKKTGTLLISHLDLLETSIVGIPANPRSWIDSVTKAIKSGPPLIGAEPTTTNGASPTFMFQAELEPTPEEPITETIVADDTADDTDIKTDATSQEALSSEPDNDAAVATPDVIAAASDVLERSTDTEVPDEVRSLFTEVHNSLAAVTERLIESDALRATAEQRAETAERERDEMRLNTENVIREVANLIDQVGKLPAGRQASFKAIAGQAQAQSIDWASMGLVPEVVRMLERGTE